MSFLSKFLGGLVLALVAALCLLLLQSDQPFLAPHSLPHSLTLGEGGYNTRELTAPVATGPLLEAIAYALTATRAGPLLRRSLLAANGFEAMRTLAEQVSAPPLYFPMRRLSRSEEEKASEAVGESVSLLETPLQELEQGVKVDVGFRTVTDYAKQYSLGLQSPSDIAARVLKEIKNFEQQGLHIFVEVRDDDVMAQARASDARHKAGKALSVFDGVLVAVKDMIPIKGLSVCNGQHPSTCEMQTVDDPIVQRFREAGAIILGSTIMTEGGVTPLGYSAHFQGPSSAYSPFHYSGGSSSGSAVAVATGLVPVAIGFDGGGSIRIPASMSGLHGLGATFGRIPNSHVSSTMIKAGPLTASALDAALAFEVMAPNLEGHFYGELYGSSGLPIPHTSGFGNVEDLSDIRLGFYEEWFYDSDPRVAEACRKSLAELESRGAVLVPITIPHLHWLAMAHSMKISSEFALGFDYEFHHAFDLLEANSKITVGIGKSFSAMEVLVAEKLRRYAFDYLTKEIFGALNVTAIVNPTIGVLPPRMSPASKVSGESNSPLVVQLMKYIFLGNLVGLPGHTVPVGYAADSVPGSNSTGPLLPIGLHLLGDHWSEHKLLRLAHALDHVHGPKRVRPVFFADVLQSRKHLGSYTPENDGDVEVEGEILSPQML